MLANLLHKLTTQWEYVADFGGPTSAHIPLRKGHIPLNPLSASSSSEIMPNCRHYFDGFRLLQLLSQSMLLTAPNPSRAS